jgi:OOP family OmpA-OmpF porin
MTKPFNLPSRRAACVAIAAALGGLSGVAAAQSGVVVDSQGGVVRGGFSECVQSGQAASGPGIACPPAAAASSPAAAAASSATAPRAQADTTRAASGPSRTAASSAASGASGAAVAPASPGYVQSGVAPQVVQDGFGGCVRSGFWTPAMAAEPCDLVARAQVPVPVVAEAPKAEPAPAPIAKAAPEPVAEPPRPVIQKLTLSTDVLFDFNSATLKDSGKARLDQMIAEIKDADVDEIIAVGHADRIASEQYNQKLSEQRAQAVRDYLSSQGAKGRAITAEGKGELEPVTGQDCSKLGPERASNRKLVACLQPDRRVEIEVLGSREVAATGSPAGTGITGGSSAPAGGGATSR